MPTQMDTIHEAIISELNVKIEEALNSFDCVIIEKRKECEAGTVPNSGVAYDSFIRSIRKKALTQLNGVKAWIGAHFRSTIIQQVRTSGFYKLHEISDEITAVEAEKQKATDEKQRIATNRTSLSDYEKYSLYGHPEYKPSLRANWGNKQLKTVSSAAKKISPNVEQVYQKYVSKKRQSLISGLIVTAICIVIDFSMIYALFLSANYSPIAAITVAVISAAMLDAPPYAFGYLWTKSEDDSDLFELQGNTETPEVRRKRRGNKILLFLIFLVIIFAFIAYLAVRVLSFLGGGDFSLAFHAVIEKNWSAIESVEFSGADFLSTIVPFSTSVVALAVGKMLYPFKTDYIKESVVVIKDEMSKNIKLCMEKIVDCDKQIRDLKASLATLKEEIWTFYLGSKPVPNSDKDFKRKVSRAFQKLNLKQYKQTYSDSCLLLRHQATVLLGSVNDQLAQYSSDPLRVVNMNLSKDEKQCLDDFWVITTSGVAQRPITQSHLSSIKNTIDEILDTLS